MKMSRKFNEITQNACSYNNIYKLFKINSISDLDCKFTYEPFSYDKNKRSIETKNLRKKKFETNKYAVPHDEITFFIDHQFTFIV